MYTFHPLTHKRSLDSIWTLSLWRCFIACSDAESLSSLWQDGSDVVLRVRVHAGAKQDAIIKEHDQSLRVDIKAQPIHGNANEALIRFFAKLFSIPVAHVEVRHGHVCKTKILVLRHCMRSEVAPIIIQSLRRS